MGLIPHGEKGDAAAPGLGDRLAGVRVAIVGAGLGGLCLAQGLTRAGADVVVYERDGSLNVRRQGYRLHIDARAGIALQRCLSSELFTLFLATCGQPSLRFTVMSERLRILHETRTGPARDLLTAESLSTSVNRQTMREVLALGLDDRLHFGKELARYRDGREIGLFFTDGTCTVADILVGADGAHSVVRRQRLSQAQICDTGERCIYGKTMLDEPSMALVPDPVKQGFAAIIGGEIGMATGLVQLRERPEIADSRLSPAGDYLMWAISGTADALGESEARLSTMSAGELHACATRIINTWHSDLRALLALAAVDQTFLVRVCASTPVDAWTPSRITLIGDAIHAMSPARGSGANTALQDAGVLCQWLATSPRDSIISAIGDYEQQMRAYGFAAVRASQQFEAETAARRHRVGYWLYRHVSRHGHTG